MWNTATTISPWPLFPHQPLLSLSLSPKNFIEITKDQETCQRAGREARAQPENWRKEKEGALSLTLTHSFSHSHSLFLSLFLSPFLRHTPQKFYTGSEVADLQVRKLIVVRKLTNAQLPQSGVSIGNPNNLQRVLRNGPLMMFIHRRKWLKAGTTYPRQQTHKDHNTTVVYCSPVPHLTERFSQPQHQRLMPCLCCQTANPQTVSGFQEMPIWKTHTHAHEKAHIKDSQGFVLV